MVPEVSVGVTVTRVEVIPELFGSDLMVVARGDASVTQDEHVAILRKGDVDEAAELVSALERSLPLVSLMRGRATIAVRLSGETWLLSSDLVGPMIALLVVGMQKREQELAADWPCSETEVKDVR